MAMALSKRFSFFSSEAHKTVTSTSWATLFPDEDLQQVLQDQQKGCSDFNQPTAEDVVIREPREEVDVYDNYYLICFQTLIHQSLQKQEQTEIPVSVALYILVFQCRAITFSLSEKHVNRVRERIRGMHNPSILSSDWICYAMIDDIMNSFEPFARDAEREREAIEDQIHTVRIDDAQILLPRVNVLRKKTAQISRCLSGKVDVLNGYVTPSLSRARSHCQLLHEFADVD
ncbi:Uncharacterized protein PECH_000492 [Penicillium ucsense]|uniref:Uncharacterized protein n=1 Tax=Penicillium ucsense TaxID=2839758 RepID=A0A8J8WIA6_9EURO|nr:Uncharacterized protein PECM_004116 [Penicillium ucsense]KAF7733526.1 Uncharacterized protein PECH_000492 [Penicillium ucsense]